MKKFPFSPSSFVAGLALAFMAQAAFGEDLFSIYLEAQKNDAAFASARYAFEAGKEKVIQGRSLLLPQVNLAANGTRSHVDFEPGNAGVAAFTPVGTRTGNDYGYAVSAIQPLYRPQNVAQYEQSKLETDVAEFQYKAAEQDLILRVAKAYFAVLQAQDGLSVSSAAKNAFSEQLAQARKRFQVGVATITDTYEAQSRYDLAVAQEITAKNDVDVSENALRLLVGKSPDRLSTVDDKAEPRAPQPNDLNYWIDAATHANYDLKSRIAAEEIARHEAQRNKDTQLPTVDLVAKYSDDRLAQDLSLAGGTDKTRTSTVGVQFNFPIYAGGALTSREREAAANYEKARQDTETTRRDIEQATKQAFLGVTSGAAQVRAYQQAVLSSRSQLDATKTGQQVGVRTNIDVLNAQQQYFEASFTLAKSRYAYLLSRLALAAAAGSLSEADLQTINRVLIDR